MMKRDNENMNNYKYSLKDLRMYILVNKDIKMNYGKACGQTGHAIASFFYKKWKASCLMKTGIDEVIEEYMEYEQKKIILFAEQKTLESLEQLGYYITIRDKGYTDLPPNTLTCVNLGILDVNNIPVHLEFIKELKLVR